ncbi:hypothetical protein B484DRAFT_425768, partial [Ochromonadaceae sp. CCMP2298]
MLVLVRLVLFAVSCLAAAAAEWEEVEVTGVSDEPKIFQRFDSQLDYKSFVGPSVEYDIMGATQFNLLTTLGLRDHHSLLDFGCGSLRAGRFFIMYLSKGNYYCVEPHSELIREAAKHDIGSDLFSLKQPHIYSGSEALFEFDVFDKYDFDFLLAQSILSHTGLGLVRFLLEEFAQLLSPDGLALVTLITLHPDMPVGHKLHTGNDWVYPGVTEFHPSIIPEVIKSAGLHGSPLKYYHPRQTWYVLSKNPARVEWAVSALDN